MFDYLLKNSGLKGRFKRLQLLHYYLLMVFLYSFSFPPSCILLPHKSAHRTILVSVKPYNHSHLPLRWNTCSFAWHSDPLPCDPNVPYLSQPDFFLWTFSIFMHLSFLGVVVLGIGLRTLCLLGSPCTTWATSPAGASFLTCAVLLYTVFCVSYNPLQASPEAPHDYSI